MIYDRDNRTQSTLEGEEENSSLRKPGMEEPPESELWNNPDEIATLAYYYWQQRGSPHDGGAEEDWYRAEKELTAKSGQ